MSDTIVRPTSGWIGGTATEAGGHVGVTIDPRSSLPVRLQPVLPVGTALLRSPPRFPPPFPFNQPGVICTYSGTAAVYQAFRALALPSGSTVLCPSYNCGHELEPLLRLGLRVDCYRVTAGMTIDVDDLARRIDGKVRAVFVTHFFGFAQRLDQVRDLCSRHGVALVEDCAHALLGDNADGTLGRIGDIAIYSARKTLPLPNGGGVTINNPVYTVPSGTVAPPPLTTWLKAVDLTKKSALDRSIRRRSFRTMLPAMAMVPMSVGAALLQHLWPASSPACYDPDDDAYDFPESLLHWDMSPLSRRLLERLDWPAVRGRRLHNYRYLAQALEGLGGCELVRPEIDDWTSPLFFPVRIKRREEVFSYLVRQRIYPAIWWDQRHPAVNWDDFPEAVALKEEVLALPVHQDVDDRQLDYLIAVMRQCPLL